MKLHHLPILVILLFIIAWTAIGGITYALVCIVAAVLLSMIGFAIGYLTLYLNYKDIVPITFFFKAFVVVAIVIIFIGKVVEIFGYS